MNSIFKKTAIASAVALTFAAVPPASAEEVATKGGLEVKSDDGLYKFKFGGRIQADADLFKDDHDAGTGANRPYDFASGTELRRMRLETVATVNKDWEGKLELDFRDSGGNTSATVLRDAYVAYKGFQFGTIRVGQFKTPYGLEHLTSDLFTTFVERSLIFNGLTNGTNTSAEYMRGIGLIGSQSNYSYAFEVYDAGNRDTANDRSADLGIASRFTWTPIKDKVQVVHLGINGGREFNKSTVGPVAAKPEANLADAITLTNGTLTDADVKRVGAEAAWVHGPFTLQSEYMRLQIDSDTVSADTDRELDSYYAYASWFVTGETRPYKASTGTWDRIVPLSPKGAWEVALRYSNVKDDDSNAEIKDATLGTNYYWNSQTRLMANIITTDARNAVGLKGKPKSLLFRIQYDF